MCFKNTLKSLDNQIKHLINPGDISLWEDTANLPPKIRRKLFEEQVVSDELLLESLVRLQVRGQGIELSRFGPQTLKL